MFPPFGLSLINESYFIQQQSPFHGKDEFLYLRYINQEVKEDSSEKEKSTKADMRIYSGDWLAS